MVDTVVGVGCFVVFHVGEGGRGDGEERVWVDGKNGEGLIGIGNVRVVDALRKVHNHEFSYRVGDIDAIRNSVIIDGGAPIGDGGNGGHRRYRAEDKSGGDGRTRVRVVDGVGKGGDVVHDVLRGVVKVKASNFEGHAVAGRLRKGMTEVMLYLYRVDDN